MYDSDDTIAAIASAPGGAARGILRISGPRTAEALAAVFEPDAGETLTAVAAARRIPGKLRIELALRGASMIPAELYFWPGRRSYTRQPLAELHAFGAPPLLAAALRTACDAGARLAAPGEFTLRAFLAGRIDLTEAEAVLGVIDAAGERELKTALAQLAGGLARPLAEARERLLDLLAHLEAGLDFVEEDIEFISPSELASQLAAITELVDELARRMAVRGVTVELPRVVLYGSPNVGKSSLFNALCGVEGAIVSDQAGTTRDYVTATLDLDGCRCELVDTAGVESLIADPAAEDFPCATGSASVPTTLADGPSCATGSASVSGGDDAHSAGLPGAGLASGAREANSSVDDRPLRAVAQQVTAAQQAIGAMSILCLDATRQANAWEVRELATEVPGRIAVFTKQDQAPDRPPAGALATSARTGAGLAELRAQLRRRLFEDSALHESAASPGAATPATAQRAAASVTTARAALAAARKIAARRAGEELVASELRHALDALGEVTGAILTDDILDRVFSRFCIGK